MIKYDAQIIAIGPMSQEFVDGGILVFFGPDAPEELAEFAIIHSGAALENDIRSGDHLVIGDRTWPVLAVGDIACQNLRALGHFVVKFNGATLPELAGDISVPSGDPPTVALGMRVQFLDQATD